MTMLLVTMFFLFFNLNEFVGIFLFLVLFLFILMNFDLFGMDLVKGDLFSMMGLDYVSFYMVLLCLWLVSLILIMFYSEFLCILMLLVLISMLFMFISMDFLYLFIWFECSILPMFLIIMFFGSSKERYEAGLYMFTYTLMSSLPMLVILMFIGSWSGSFSIDYMNFNLFSFDGWVQGSIIFMFLVKVPMFIVHIWLPKAHVEAPVYGSMVLASVMLKMGGYGIIRCMDFMIINNFISDFFFCLCLCGGLIISYNCLFQVDLKVLVAYSSIVHMGMMLMGFFSYNEMGYLGGVIMMLSHGVCSSGLFYLVNEIYKVSGSRLVMLNKGCMSVMPVLTWMWLGMLVNNLGIPPCFGVLGELMLLSGCLMYSCFVFFIFFFIIFFVSCFVINMYSLLVDGVISVRSFNSSLISYYGGMLHLVSLNSFIFFMDFCF